MTCILQFSIFSIYSIFSQAILQKMKGGEGVNGKEKIPITSFTQLVNEN